MKLKTTLALALLVGAGVALYHFRPPLLYAPWTSAPVPERDRADTRAALAQLTPDRIASLSIRSDGQNVATLARTYSGGYVTSGDWPANPDDAGRVFDTVGTLHSRFVAEESRPGLSLPLTIDVLTRDDMALVAATLTGTALTDQPLAAAVAGAVTRQVRQQRLSLGEAAEGDYRFVRPTYLRLGDRDELLRLAPGLVTELSRPADQYRQRRLFPAERAARVSNAQERVEKLDVRELFVQHDRGASLRLVKGRNGWELVYPSRDHLDPETGERLLTAVADLWVEQFVHTDPAAVGFVLQSPVSSLLPLGGLAALSHEAALHRTGLDRPTQSIQVTRHDGSVVTLLLGQRSRSEAPPPPPRPGMPPPPIDSYRYAKLANSDLIFEVQDSRLGDIFVTFDALRDNRVARFNADDVERLTLRHGGQVVELIKEKKDTWKMLSPRDTAADGEKVKELLQKLSSLEGSDKDVLGPSRQAGLAVSLVAAGRPLAALTAALLAKESGAVFGLRQPTGEVTVVVLEKARGDDRDRSRERTITLRLGKPGWAGNRIFVQQAGWPRVDALDDMMTALLERPAVSYRGKQLLDFAASDVARVEVRSVGLAASRIAAGGAVGVTVAELRGVDVILQREGDGWTLRTSVTAGADTKRVNDLLDALGKAKALTYVGEKGVERPLYQVKVTFKDATKPARTLSLGEPRGAEPGYLAQLDGAADAFALPGELHDRLVTPALAYLPATLWQVAPDDEITSFRIAKAGQDEYRLIRKGDDWQVAGPFTVAAPSDVVERLSAALLAPRAEEYRAYPAGDLTAYGLAKPAVRLTLTTKKGKEHSLVLGSATTDGKEGRFATQGGGAGVFVVSDALAKAVDQSALDFLDRNLLTFDPGAATAVVRQRGGDVLELTRHDDAWRLTKPTDQPADDRKVPDLLRTLSTLRAERLVAYNPKELKPWGLDRPEATVTVKLGAMEKVLLIGREEGNSRIAMVKDAPAVAVLPVAAVRQLLAPPLAFRNHDLARVPDADTMKLEAGDRKATFARPEGTWKVTQPISADADHDALEGYFNGLARLRADELVAEKPTAEELKRYGLEKASARWQILNGDKLEIELVIGALESLGRRRYARLGDKGVVFLLDDRLSGQVVAEYRPRPLWKDTIDPAQIESVKFGYSKDDFTLTKAGGDWRVEGKPDVKLDSATVSDTLSALRDLKLERYVRDDGAQLKLYGLDPPTLVLEVKTPTGKYTLDLGGVEGGSKRRYARLPTSKFKDVFVLDEAASAKLTRDLATLTKPLAKAGKPGDF